MTHPDEAFELDVGRIWRHERVSCPHRDVLRTFVCGALPGGAADFVTFHISVSKCPYCCAIVEELRVLDAEAPDNVMSDLRDRLLRSTRSAIRARGTES